jgi:hypothetical protein
VVTACQRVGIRSQVQRLSRPHRGERRARRRRRGQREGGVNGDSIVGQNGSEPVAEALETTPLESENGAIAPELEPTSVEQPAESE